MALRPKCCSGWVLLWSPEVRGERQTVMFFTGEGVVKGFVWKFELTS